MMRRKERVGFMGLACCVLGLAALVLGGCSKGGYSGPTGTVSGKITLDGKPVPQGSLVTFLSDTGFTGSGKVGADGSYTLMNVDKPEIPVAKYKVAVTTPAGDAAGGDYDKYMTPGGAGEGKIAPQAIPVKFQNPATSGLSVEVKAGPNTIPIDLK